MEDLMVKLLRLVVLVSALVASAATRFGRTLQPLHPAGLLPGDQLLTIALRIGLKVWFGL
jgi:hypothetical protein